MSLSQFFAKRLLDPITKSEVVIGLDAQKGAGKSVSSLRLAEDVAKELSFMYNALSDKYNFAPFFVK